MAIYKSRGCRILNKLSLFLNSCFNVMNSIHYLEELNHPVNMKAIIAKLPYKLKEKWRSNAFDLHDQRRRRVRLVDLVHFVDKQAQILSHPVFGNLKDVAQISRGSFQLPQLPRSHQSEKDHQRVANDKARRGQCHHVQSVKYHGKLSVFCSYAHKLESCCQFNRKFHKDKLEFLKKKGVCFECFESEHMS